MAKVKKITISILSLFAFIMLNYDFDNSSFASASANRINTSSNFNSQIFFPLIINENLLPLHWRDGLASGVNWGIAQAYPDDLGITKNPYVLAAEGFETGTVTIPTEENRYLNHTTVVTAPTYTGNYAGQHTWPQGYSGITTRFKIPQSANIESRPAYFVRMCMNFDKSFHPGDSFDSVGVKGFGIYSQMNGVDTSQPSNGTNWYNAAVQFVGWGPSIKPEANNGFLWVGHLYSYNPYPYDAISSVGILKVTSPYRFSSYADPFDYIKFNEWNCYEVGLYLNTPGLNDGEARFWINGILQSRVTHMRYRDIENLYPTDVDLNLYRTTVNFPQTMIRWTDNIVIAMRYIGPVNK